MHYGWQKLSMQSYVKPWWVIMNRMVINRDHSQLYSQSYWIGKKLLCA